MQTMNGTVRRACITVLGLAHLALAGVSLAEDRDVVAPDRATSGKWRISGGVIHRSVDAMRMTAGTRSRSGLVPEPVAAGRRGPRADIGPPDAIGDRHYDDGFVLTDPGVVGDGDTWYWGYENASQVLGSDTITFHADDGTRTEVSRSTTQLEDNESVVDAEGSGPYIRAERLWRRPGPVTVGACVSISWVSLSEGAETTTFRDDQEWTSYRIEAVDAYELLGVVPPDAPYAGTFLGPGPLLPNVPASRSASRRRADSGQYKAYNTVHGSLDVDLTTLSLGVLCELRLGPAGLTAAAGPALNFIRIDASQRETLYGSLDGAPPLVLEDWSDAATDDSIEVGAFVESTLFAQLTERIGVGLFGRYDWLDETAGTVGPSTYRLDLSGGSAGVVIAFDF